MRYRYERPQRAQCSRSRIYVDERKRCWLLSEHGKNVIGEIRPGKKEAKGGELVHGERVLDFSLPLRKKRFFQHCRGYLPCHSAVGEETSIAVYGWNVRKIMVAFLLLIILLAALTRAVYLYYVWATPVITEDDIVTVQLPQGNAAQAAGSDLLPDYTRLEWALSSERTITWLYNPEGNRCAVRYRITLADGRLLYESDVLQPGEVIQGFTPYHALGEGSYAYTMECQLIDMESKQIVSTQRFEGEMDVRA